MPRIALICLALAAVMPRPADGGHDARFAGIRFMGPSPPGELPLTPPRHATSPGTAITPLSPAYPLYSWPLGRQLGDGLLVVNYMDHDATAGRLDYQGGMHTYDGHRGTDYVLHNFRLMDRGCPVLAASAGTVAFVSPVAPGAFDRNCLLGGAPDEGNWVWIHNGNGTYSEYYHLRSWSLTVQVGDAVQVGQMLGLAGSSGYSTAPHLHFETGDYSGGPYAARDPYTGPQNPLPSLWQHQESYQGDDPLHFVDIGIFSDDAVGGSVFNTTYCDVQEGIHAPTTFGIHEPHLDLWVQFQGNPGDPFRIEIVKPDGTLWTWFEDVLSYDAQFDWFWAYWFWDGGVGTADYGTWKVRAYANGFLSRELPFQVGPTTIYSPRFRPAGRSFRINGSLQTENLQLTPLSPAVTFTLVDALPQVTLVGSMLKVGATSSQPHRSEFFQVVATDGQGRSDVAWFHLVDMTRPIGDNVGVSDAGPRLQPPQIRATPNPTSGSVAIEFHLPASEAVEIDVYDVAGRLVRRLLRGVEPQGAGHRIWDGRDAEGREVPAGVYLARVATASEKRTTRIVMTR